MSKIWEIIPQNEVETSIRSRIKCYLDGFPDDIPFNMDIMMERMLDGIRNYYVEINGIDYGAELTDSQLIEITEAVEHYRPMVQKMVSEASARYCQKAMARRIIRFKNIRLSDEQLLNEVFKAAPHYIADLKPNGKFTQEGCTAAVIKRLKALFKESNGIRFFDELKEPEIQEFNAVVDYFMPSISVRVSIVEMEYRKGLMEAAIKKAKAESNIVAAFDKAGFETRAEYFDHKALVKVRLDDSGWTMFWVEYDDIDKEGYLDSFVSTAIRLKNSHSKTK